VPPPPTSGGSRAGAPRSPPPGSPGGPAPPAATPTLKVHKNENFDSASILNFVLFHCKLCKNNKILGNNFLNWTIMGGATIIPRRLKTTGNKKKFQDRPNFFLFFKSYMTL
jgi:hypothetical protein